MKAQITFKSGAQIIFDTEGIETAHAPVSGDLAKLSWHTPDNWTAKLDTITDLSEIVAIVLLRDDPTEPARPSWQRS